MGLRAARAHGDLEIFVDRLPAGNPLGVQPVTLGGGGGRQRLGRVPSGCQGLLGLRPRRGEGRGGLVPGGCQGRGRLVPGRRQRGRRLVPGSCQGGAGLLGGVQQQALGLCGRRGQRGVGLGRGCSAGVLGLGRGLGQHVADLVGELATGAFALRVEPVPFGGGGGRHRRCRGGHLLRVGVGARPYLGGLFLGEPDHPLHPVRQAGHRDRLLREVVELGAQLVDLTVRGLQLSRHLGQPLVGRVTVGGRDPQVVLEPFQMRGDLVRGEAAADEIEGDLGRQPLIGTHAPIVPLGTPDSAQQHRFSAPQAAARVRPARRRCPWDAGS